MNRKNIRSSGMLTLTALIWGVAFVAQSVGMDYVGPFTFNAARFLLGSVVLIPCIVIIKRVNTRFSQAMDGNTAAKRKKYGIVGGICCGLAICLGSTLQQIGISYTTVGKAGFITSLYIIIVPVFGIFIRKKVAYTVWISVAIATLGMYLLCMNGGLSIGKGDFYVFLCAIAFSLHIMVIDFFSSKADGVFMSCIQFLTAGLISSVFMFLFEKPEWTSLTAALAPVLYAGVMSCGVGYTLQVVAQKDIDPVIASLLMSLESVFSLIAGWILLGQALKGKELLGCAFVFIAIILAQIPMERIKKTYLAFVGRN